ncbi:hypothetical protein PMZ80_005965 [Knufia obscura]|uniref:Uncharacterized protein n=2 Tax=Knufia TaxID=430999 RepID=A0AAN8I8I2_9EURO|nr:hypothetical protein PMZ80_005965 [Knufia obscura]KAK5954636.1 hypothetical protein OHC33_004358 [Knufia fluminis]
MFCLFRTITTDASLASLVKEISISQLGDYDLGKAYRLLRRELPKPCTRYLHPAKKAAIDLLLLEAIMLRLKNLEELSLCVTAVPEDAIFFDSRRWSAKNLPGMPILPVRKKFIVFTCEEERHILAQVQKVLPGQKELYVELDSPLSLTNLDVSCLYTIEQLDVMIEGMSEGDFEKLISNLPNLKRLDYHGGDSDEFNDWNEEEEATRLVHIVDVSRSQCKERSLASLEIHFYQPEDFDEIFDRRDIMPDLTDFVRLTYLALDSAALLDPKSIKDPYYGSLSTDDPASSSDSEPEFSEHIAKRTNFLPKLPRSLEKLSIFKSDGRIIKELQELAKRKEQDFPS